MLIMNFFKSSTPPCLHDLGKYCDRVKIMHGARQADHSRDGSETSGGREHDRRSI